MRYMLLIYTREGTLPGGEEQMERIRQRHLSAREDASKLGILQGAEPLQPTSTATTVRMQDGKRLVIDGPFAETKEQLGGYYILDCRNLDEAIEWASRIPTECGGGGTGCIEIRPLMAMTRS